jgi:hypothetical protein
MAWSTHQALFTRISTVAAFDARHKLCFWLVSDVRQQDREDMPCYSPRILQERTVLAGLLHT